jgi:hypothetical protein
VVPYLSVAHSENEQRTIKAGELHYQWLTDEIGNQTQGSDTGESSNPTNNERGNSDGEV